MATTVGNALARSIDVLVRGLIVPVTSAIPFLVRTGLLFAAFAALWVAFLAAMVVQPAALGDAWRTIGALPLPALGLAWLLFLPQVSGLWIWATDWPEIVRIILVVSIAAWNLIVFIPRRETVAPAAIQ
jgi:hypothetical protein